MSFVCQFKTNPVAISLLRKYRCRKCGTVQSVEEMRVYEQTELKTKIGIVLSKDFYCKNCSCHHFDPVEAKV